MTTKVKPETSINGTTVFAVRGIAHSKDASQIRASLEVSYAGETIESLLPRAFASDIITWQDKLRRGHTTPAEMERRILSLKGSEGRIVIPASELVSPSWNMGRGTVTRVIDPCSLDTATLVAAIRKKAEAGDPAAILALQALEG